MEVTTIGTPVKDILGRIEGARLFPVKFHHVGGLTQCLLRDGTTGLHQDFGNSFSETFRVGLGPGFRCVNVQLAGWYLDFAHKDHKIDTIQVRISNVTYNTTTGEVSFTVGGYYRDKNGDDDFEWEVWYTILGLG